jgi:hypothetical protein
VVSSSSTFLGENREKTLIICGGRRGWATVAAAMMGGTAVGHGPLRSILHRGVAPLVGIRRPCCRHRGIGEGGEGW